MTELFIADLSSIHRYSFHMLIGKQISFWQLRNDFHVDTTRTLKTLSHRTLAGIEGQLEILLSLYIKDVKSVGRTF